MLKIFLHRRFPVWLMGVLVVACFGGTTHQQAQAVREPIWEWRDAVRKVWQPFPKVVGEKLEGALDAGSSGFESKGTFSLLEGEDACSWMVYFCDAVQIAEHVTDMNEEDWESAKKRFPLGYYTPTMHRSLRRTGQKKWEYRKQGWHRFNAADRAAEEALDKMYLESKAEVSYELQFVETVGQAKYTAFRSAGMLQINGHDWKRAVVRRRVLEDASE